MRERKQKSVSESEQGQQRVSFQRVLEYFVYASSLRTTNEIVVAVSREL